jgi:hypothetical protein
MPTVKSRPTARPKADASNDEEKEKEKSTSAGGPLSFVPHSVAFWRKGPGPAGGLKLSDNTLKARKRHAQQLEASSRDLMQFLESLELAMFYKPLLEFGVQAVHELRNDIYSDIVTSDSKNHATEVLISDTELIEAVGLPRLQMRRLRKAALKWNADNKDSSAKIATPETPQVPEDEDGGDVKHVAKSASQPSPANQPSAHLLNQSRPKNRNRSNQLSQSTTRGSNFNRKPAAKTVNGAKVSTWGRLDAPSTPNQNPRNASAPQETITQSGSLKLQQSKKVSPASAAFLERMVLQEEARQQRLAAKQAQSGLDVSRGKVSMAQQAKKTPKNTAKLAPSREPGSPSGSASTINNMNSTQGRLYTLGKKTIAMKETPKPPRSKASSSTSGKKQVQNPQTPATDKRHGTTSSPEISPNFGHRLAMKGGHADKEKRRKALQAQLDAATLRDSPLLHTKNRRRFDPQKQSGGYGNSPASKKSPKCSPIGSPNSNSSSAKAIGSPNSNSSSSKGAAKSSPDVTKRSTKGSPKNVVEATSRAPVKTPIAPVLEQKQVQQLEDLEEKSRILSLRLAKEPLSQPPALGSASAESASELNEASARSSSNSDGLSAF